MKKKDHRKEVRKMGADIAVNFFRDEVIGSKELRENISNVLEKVTKEYQIIYSGNIKKNNRNTAAILSTVILADILKAYKFSTMISFDETTKQYEAIIPEIECYGVGDTREEAVETLIESMVDLTQDYFENTDLYMRMPETRVKLPYYLKIKQCKSIQELTGILGLS